LHLLTAAALLIMPLTTARAAGVATFRLTNTDPAGAAPVNEVLARVLPPGSAVPRDVDKDPPTILDAGTGYLSSGFNPDDLQVSIGEGTTATGEPFQAIKLDFGAGGFAPGGRLYFQLNKSPSYDGLITLVLPTSVENLAMEAIDVPPGVVPPGNPGGAPQVPEPSSVLIWTGLAAAAVWRARAFRRNRILAGA
jgi:hypothetical protein